MPIANCIRDTKGRQLVTRSGLQRTRCCECHHHDEQAMTALGSVRKIFKTVLQQVHHVKVDVIAGDANAAAYKNYNKQEYQHLHNSSVAVMLREMQRVVNMGRPCESSLHIDNNANNHFSQLGSAGDLDCASWPFSHEENHLDPEFWSNEKRKGQDSSYPKGIEALLRETARQGYPDPGEVNNPMIAPLDFDPDESWSSKTKIFGYDQQIFPCISPFL